MDLIWFSLDRVDNKYSSTSFSLAKELAKHHRVFYVDNPITFAEVLREKMGKNSRSESHTNVDIPKNFFSIKPNMSLSINWMANGMAYQWLSRVNNYLLNRSLKKLIADHKIKDFVFVNVFNPFYARRLSSKVKPLVSAYYSVDDIRFSPHVKKHGPHLEKDIVGAYDITLTTSKELQILLMSFSKNVYYLPNAADIPLFKTALSTKFEKPDDIKSVTKPIILYTGHVDWRVDIDLLKAVALGHADKALVLVGPVSLNPSVMEELSAIPNILFTGSKKLELLPAYLQYSKCAIIPFKCNTLTKSIYPLKINEYLAAGLPVVSTSFSEDIRQFGDVINLEDETNSFVIKIQEAIDGNSDEKVNQRSKVAESNSWEARALLFWEIVGKYIKKVNE
ncbi:MAG TPA: glycosyltransferase [Chryseolinea sp.]|nr:glycosyltransferase [Chryseolinea sp.]